MNHSNPPVSAQSTPELTISGPIATLTLNRPQHRNRLENADLATLRQHFTEINADTSILVVILRGATHTNDAKKAVFSAGYHIGDYGDARPEILFEHIADELENLRPVTLCVLEGSVFGGATDLVLACDFAFAVPGVTMRMPAAAIGLHYYPGGLSRYVSRLGVANAKKAFLTAHTFSTTEMLQIGYIHEIIEHHAIESIVAERARQIAALAPIAVQTLKRSLNEIARGDFDPARLLARELASQSTADFAEGRRAFAERRTPTFLGH